MTQSINQLKTKGSSSPKGGEGSGFDFGSLLGGATSIAGTIGGWVGDIKNSARSQVNTYDMDYTNDLINSPFDIANMRMHSIDTNSINAPSKGKQTLNVFKNIGEGAAAGSTINVPWGTIVGAVAGLGTGMASAFTQNATYRNDIAKANLTNANSFNVMSSLVGQGADKLASVGGLSDRFNNIMAQGGKMNSNYTNQNLYNTNNTIIDAGGSHEQNPVGGVIQGVDGSGTPNMVEEGEVVYTDLDTDEKRVLSARIKPEPEILTKHNLNANIATDSYAESAKKIIAMFDGRNDPFSNKTKNMLLNRLFDAQEEQKINEAAAAYGMTPEEYVAMLQQQEMEAQAQQEAMAQNEQAAQQDMTEEEIMQLAEQYGVSPEEIMAQLQQQGAEQQMQQAPEYYGSDMEQAPYGNYGALGGTFEYGPYVEESPIMGYDNYLLERSRVNTQPVNYYPNGGPIKPIYKASTTFPYTLPNPPRTALNREKYIINNLPNSVFEPSELPSDIGINESIVPGTRVNKLPAQVFEPSYFPEDLGVNTSEPPEYHRPYTQNIREYLGRQFNPSLPDIERSDELANYSPVENKDRVRPNWEQIKNTIGIMNPLRFANAIDSFSSWVNPEKLDTWYSDFLKGEYNPIPYTGPIGRHQEFQPVDAYRNLGIAQASRASAIARNNTMSPNSRANVAANMAVDRMYSNQLGDMYAHETQQDIDRLNNIIAYNNQLDAGNNQRMIDIHNANLAHRADTIGRSALAYEASKDARKAAIDQARSAYFEDLSKIGQELSYRASIDSNPSFAYTSYNNYKIARDYDRWLRINGLEDSPENFEAFKETR